MRWPTVFLLCFVLLLCSLKVSVSWGAEQIPLAAHGYRADLTRQARLVWGLDAPVATFAAQIHTESKWRPDAVSPVGARGLAQFMPSTEAWINDTYRWNNGDATNPAWALRALVTYDRWLWDRLPSAASACERFAMTLSAYNGGLGWLQKDQRIAAVALGKGPRSAMRWFDEVERFNSGRSPAAFRENRAYPRLILTVREPLYVASGWGFGVCA
jgi:soluble lytic murein transglycosylase-like protein